MTTITYNPETHALVPREPSEEMLRKATKVDLGKDCDEKGILINLYQVMLAATPQPEQVDSEPVAWWNGKETAFFEHEVDGPVGEVCIPLYTTPQPDRTAELEQLRQRIAELDAQHARDVHTLECWNKAITDLQAERDSALETIKQQHRIHVELVKEKEVAEAKADEEQKHSCKMVYQRDIANVEIINLKAALMVAKAGIEWALSNINCEPFEWSDEENADAHREAIEALAKVDEVLK